MIKILLTATVQSHICQFHRPLVKMLREMCDAEIHVAAKDNLNEKNGLKLDFVDKIFNVPFSRTPKSIDNFKAYKQLKDIINKENYNIIHCNTPMGGILTRLAANKTRNNGCRVLYTAHGFHFYDGAPKKNWLVYYTAEKFFAKKTDVLITINKEDYELAKEKFSCTTEHIHGVGVDPNRYYPASDEEKKMLIQKFSLSTQKRYILCVGELLPNKNQSMAIRAMEIVASRFPDVVLLLAGNGTEKKNLKTLVSELGLQNNVRFIGYVTNLEEYQKISEIAVSCSKREGLGLNLIEAMLSGNPVVATRNRGHNELIQENRNGYLVESGDVNALAERLISLLNRERILSTDNIIESVKSYTNDVVYEELKDIYYRDIF